MNRRIYLSPPHMSGDEMKYILSAFCTNWIAPMGPNVDAFEEEVAAYIGVNGAVALSAGTAAIHLALKSFGVQQGDYVFCSSFTFAGSCNPILYEKAIPVFIDAEPDSWNMSPKALALAFERFKKKGKLPKAIIIVNLYGQSADYDKLLPICDYYNVSVIEDAAESIGATYKGKQTGTFGKIGIFSFNGNKIITTSGGGMAVSDDLEVLKKIKFWSTQAREPGNYYEHKEIGYNYRMSNIIAGIGRGQIRVLNDRIKSRKRIHDTYKEAFEDLSEIKMMPIAEYGFPNYWLTIIMLDKNSKTRPCEIISKLEEDNIESRRLWKPMHLQPLFKECDYFYSSEDTSAKLFEDGLCLPSGTAMTDDEISRVISRVRGAIK